jgi:hypothetical protein
MKARGGVVGYLGEFEQLILFAALQLDRDAYGVRIRETIEERTGRVVASGARALMEDAYSTIQAMAGALIPTLADLAEG